MPADPHHDSWKPGEPWEKALDELEYIRGLAREMGGLDRIARFHEKGKYTARERMERLADPGTFLEAGPLVGATEYAADGNLTSFKPGAYVMGLAEINGRPVAIGGDDSTISGGSPHDVHKGPWQYTQPLSLTYGIPYVALIEGVGHSSKADEHSGRMALSQGDHWWRLAELMRNVPVAAGFMGACAGLPAAAGCVSHFNCMVKDQAQVFPSGPPVVERAIGERIHKNDLGGYQMHVHTSGEVDNAAEDEEDLFDQIRSFLSYLPDNMYGVAERVETGDDPQRPVEELLHLMPTRRTRGYDPRRLIQAGGGQRRVLRDAALLRRLADHRLRPLRRLQRGHHRQRPDGHGGGDGRPGGRQVRPLRDALRRVQPAHRDLPRHARLHAGLGGRAGRADAPRRAGAAGQRRGGSAQGGVRGAQVVRRGGRRAAQHRPPLQRQPALRLAGRRVGRHPHRGRRRGGLQARDRGRARPGGAPADDRGAAAAPALADEGGARLSTSST